MNNSCYANLAGKKPSLVVTKLNPCLNLDTLSETDNTGMILNFIKKNNNCSRSLSRYMAGILPMWCKKTKQLINQFFIYFSARKPKLVRNFRMVLFWVMDTTSPRWWTSRSRRSFRERWAATLWWWSGWPIPGGWRNGTGPGPTSKSVCLSLRPAIGLYVCLSVFRSVRLSACQSVCMSTSRRLLFQMIFLNQPVTYISEETVNLDSFSHNARSSTY